MRIIVVGAGEVGSYVAERLSRQGHHVVLIESDAERFRQVDQDLDVMTLRGSGTDPVTLAAAGIEQADLLVAVTPVDETNIVSALLARRAGVSKTVIRVESRPLRRPEVAALFDGADDHLVIDPDEEVAHAVLRLMEYPGAMEVNQMAGGEVEVLTARLPGHAPLVGVSLRALGAELEPDWDFIVGSITRRETDADEERTIIPRGDWILRKGDLLTVICKRRALGEQWLMTLCVYVVVMPVPLKVVDHTNRLFATVRVDRLQHHGLPSHMHMRLEVLESCGCLEDMEILSYRSQIRYNVESRRPHRTECTQDRSIFRSVIFWIEPDTEFYLIVLHLLADRMHVNFPTNPRSRKHQLACIIIKYFPFLADRPFHE